MPIPAETIRLQLTRYGDRWDLASAQRNRGLSCLEADGELVSTVARELADVADHPPGVVLEAIARELDRRETERLTVKAIAEPIDLETAENVARVVEVLERVLGRDPLRTSSIADLARLDAPSAIAALERAELDGVVEFVATTGDGARLWRLSDAVRATLERSPIERLADEQRAAAQDDPRGEADR